MIPNNREVMAMARDHGLLVAGGGDNCIRLLPPLNMTLQEAQEVVQRLERTFETARGKAAA
jgi:acetylornithine/N-succinyldiaminopimelate aminotransferase